jgi:hypothetical protein
MAGAMVSSVPLMILNFIASATWCRALHPEVDRGETGKVRCGHVLAGRIVVV